MSRERRRQKYERDLLAAAEKAMAEGRIKPGQCYTTSVYHDDWCEIYTAKLRCNCNYVIGEPQAVSREQAINDMVEEAKRMGNSA